MAKTLFKVLLGTIATGIVIFGIWLYMIASVFSSLHDDTWQVEKQIVLREYFSPDSLNKIGLYKYDSGALGYTAIQMSLVDSSEGYPLKGNVLMINRIPPSIMWITNDSISVVLDTINTPGFRIEPTKTIYGVTIDFIVR